MVLKAAGLPIHINRRKHSYKPDKKTDCVWRRDLRGLGRHQFESRYFISATPEKSRAPQIPAG